MQEAFETLKESLITAPVLAYSSYKKSFIVCTDASDKAVEAVLSQLHDDEREHPAYFSSRILSKAETKYSSFERRALAVIFALVKFRYYLLYKMLKLHPNRQSLKYVFNMKDLHGRIARWFGLLAEYDFKVCYKPGKQKATAY